MHFFVDQVLEGLDEGALYRLSIKVATGDINFGILINRTSLTLDITMTIENNFTAHLPLPLFTF